MKGRPLADAVPGVAPTAGLASATFGEAELPDLRLVAFDRGTLPSRIAGSIPCSEEIAKCPRMAPTREAARDASGPMR